MEWSVELRKGGLEAVATPISGPFEPGAAATQILQRMKELGATNGLQPDQVRQSIAAALTSGGQPPSEGVVVACGTPAQPGTDAQILPFFPITDTPVGDGVNPFETYTKNVAYPGQPILQRTPPSDGIPGVSLLGTPLPASEGGDIVIVPGDGVSANEDGTVYKATAYGIVLFFKGQLKVLSALSVSEDRMEARMTVLPDPQADEDGQVGKLIETLASLEVTHGLDREALAQAVANARGQGKPVPRVVVARGQDPVGGRETDYRLLLDSEKKVGKVLDGDRIDFREAEMVKNVNRGDTLAEVISGITPAPGFRVDGTPLRAPMERAEGLKPGQNTVPSEDGLRILADANGMLVVKGGKFHVADEYMIQGDVDYRTGNIHASGAVLVRGQVKPGFQVTGGKGVEVLQDVEEAVVEAKADIVVRGGVTAGSRIISGRHVTAKYIQNSRVQAEGDLEVKLSVTNSEVYVKGKVKAGGSQGAILGGVVNAALGLEARTIGSPSSKTHVAVGVDLLLLREIEGIDKERSAVMEELKMLQSSLGRNFLADPRRALAAMPAGLRKSKLEMLQRMKALYQKDQDMSAQRDMLGVMDQELRNAQIAVQGEIHAGTTVTVSSARTTLTEDLHHVLLYFDSQQNKVAWRRL